MKHLSGLFIVILLLGITGFCNGKSEKLDVPKIMQMHIDYLVKHHPEKAIDIINKHDGNIFTELYLSRSLAQHYLITGNLDSAQYFTEYAMEMAEKHDLDNKYNENLIFLGDVYYDNRQYDEAYKLYDKAKKYYNTVKDSSSIGRLYLNKAAVLMNVGKNEQALNYLITAKKYFDDNVDVYEIGAVYENIAQINANLGYEKICKINTHKAIDHYKQLEDSSYLATAYASLGVSYRLMEQPDSAMYYYKRAVEIGRIIKDDYTLAQAWMNMGNVSDDAGKQKEALDYYQKSLEICLDNNIMYGIYLNNINIASIKIKQEKYREAQNLLEKALAMEREHAFGHLKTVYENLIELHKNKGNYKEAVSFAEKLIYLKDSLHADKRESKVKDIQERYESEKLKSELYKYRNEEQQERISNLYFIGFVIILVMLLLFVIYFIFSKWRSDKQKAMLAQSEKEKIHIKLEAHKRELLSKSQRINKMQEFYGELKQKLKRIKTDKYRDCEKAYNEVIRFINTNGTIPHENNDLNEKLYNINYKFVEKLKKTYPTLTQSELQICMYLYLGMTSKDIANNTNRSTRTVSNLRYRVRKKMNIDRQTDLAGFLQIFASDL